MNRIIKLSIIAVMLTAVPTNLSAQTYRDDFANYMVAGGFQKLYHDGNDYGVGTLQAEVVYSFFGSRIGLSYGPDYISFSPFGIVMFSASAFMDGWNSIGGDPILRMMEMVTLLAAVQFHIPLNDQIEITTGWDALKFTKLKPINDKFYLTGSLNVGLSVFLGEHLFVNGYYEFNHTHNGFIKFLNFMEMGTNEQPMELRGHSWGAQLGWQF